MTMTVDPAKVHERVAVVKAEAEAHARTAEILEDLADGERREQHRLELQVSRILDLLPSTGEAGTDA